MEPKSSGQFEGAPSPSEYLPPISNPETGELIERPYERVQPSPEAKPQEPPQQPTASSVPIAIPLPPTVHPLPSSQPTAAPSDDISVAADEDLIEKEWVDKTKKIIEATKDDPARREREISKLQADYLMKRYSKQLGKTE